MEVGILIRSALIVGALAFFAACEGANGSAPVSPIQSAVSDTPEADRERLLTRVNEYWQARVQQDMKVAFQYELPHSRQLDEAFYVSNVGKAVKVLEFSVADFQLPLKATKAPIPLQLKYEYFFPIPGVLPMVVPTQITDSWEKDQGIWYHILDTKPLAIKPREEQTSSGPADAPQ